MDEAVNYTREAFLGTGNLVFVLFMVAAATTAALFPGAPTELFGGLLLLGVGVELLYLGVRSSNHRFRRWVRRQKHAENRETPARSEIYRHLSRRSQQRYYRLRQFKEEIQANYRQLRYASQGLLNTHLEKIDGLLRSYLDLLYQRERYYGLVSQSTEEHVRQSIQALQEDIDENAERVRSVKQRRLDVLEKRLDRFQKARETLSVIGAQLNTIEDVVKYIHEQSWSLQNPEEVTMQLDTLLEEVEQTQRSVHEIEAASSQPAASPEDDLRALDEELSAAVGADRDETQQPGT